MRVLSLVLFFLLVSCKVSYPRVNVNSISSKEKERVYNFGKRIHESCVTRQFVQLSTREVTQHLSELSLEEMQYTCDVLDKRNGKFIDMKLIEVIDETYFNRCNVYRYKANFERNEFLNEIRIWVNLDGKFAGIISREWKDEYVPTK
jgi:hypothetical protein